MGKGRATRKLLLGVLAVVTVVGAGTAQAASPAGIALRGSTPHWLSNAKDLGAVSGRDQVGFGVLLRMRNQARAVASLRAISTPGSAQYGRWLTNKQFDARYAPTAASVAAVQRWMRS